MTKRIRFTLAAASIIVILILLAIFLEGQARGIVLGLLFIALFVAIFGGIPLLITYLGERFFTRPRNPTHLCLYCYSLYENPEEEFCPYCETEFGLQKPVSSLNAYLQANSQETILRQIYELNAKLKQARGRNILYIEHDLKYLRRILKLKEKKDAGAPPVS